MEYKKVNSGTQKEILDSLCLPYLWMPIYKCYNGHLWADDKQVSAEKGTFEPEVDNSFLVGVLEFHPFGHDQTYYEIA